jgi:hypothetical protein
MSLKDGHVGSTCAGIWCGFLETDRKPHNYFKSSDSYLHIVGLYAHIDRESSCWF